MSKRKKKAEGIERKANLKPLRQCKTVGELLKQTALRTKGTVSCTLRVLIDRGICVDAVKYPPKTEMDHERYTKYKDYRFSPDYESYEWYQPYLNGPNEGTPCTITSFTLTIWEDEQKKAEQCQPTEKKDETAENIIRNKCDEATQEAINQVYNIYLGFIKEGASEEIALALTEILLANSVKNQ